MHRPEPNAQESDRVWNQSAHHFLLRMTRLRFITLLPMAIFLCATWRWDQGAHRGARVAGLALTLGFSLAFFLVQFLALRRLGPRPALVAADLLTSFCILAALLLLTGGVDSPATAIVPAGAIFVALHPARPRPLWAFLALLCAPLLLCGALALAGRAPPPPSFFSPGSDGGRPAYVTVLLLILTFASVSMALLGARARQALEQVVHDAGQARAGEVAALLSQNREILHASDTLAHELKNPLASLRGLAQLLERAAPEQSKEKERLQVMRREIDRMREVLDELRGLQRPLSVLEPRLARLDELVREVALLQQGQAQARGVVLSSRAPGALAWICDARKLKAALLNLLQNSLEATAAGGRIEIAVEPCGGGARLSVRDSGTGLSAEARRHLFTPGCSTKAGGSGIGLLLARQVARQHGGDLEIGDAPGGGCLAVLTLPTPGPGAAA